MCAPGARRGATDVRARRNCARSRLCCAPMTEQGSDLAGKVVLVTGANTGIGRVSAETLARRGAKVFLACRSEEKTRPVIEGIRASGGAAEFLSLDLADLASVRRAARHFATGEALHVLLNNAGLAGLQGLTRDGFEVAFGTNHLGHFLLTMLLLPRLRETAPARIVNVASTAHYQAKGLDFLRGAATARDEARRDGRVPGEQALQRALHEGARTRQSGRRRAQLRAAPGRGRVGRVARGSANRAAPGDAVHEEQRGGRAHLAVVRHFARRGRPRRALLRHVRREAALAPRRRRRPRAHALEKSLAWTGLSS